MDDSNMFFEWAMETLQQDPPPAAATYAVLQELLQNGAAPAPAAAAGAAQERATDSWNSGGWNFTSTVAQPTIPDEPRPTAPARPPDVPEPEPEPAHRSPASRKSSVMSAARTGHTSPEQCVQDHVMAERKRREKINRRFIELSTVIPGLKKVIIHNFPATFLTRILYRYYASPRLFFYDKTDQLNSYTNQSINLFR